MQNGIDTHILKQKITKKGEISVHCENCAKYIARTNWYYHKRTNEHKLKCTEKPSSGLDVYGVKCMKSSFNNRIITYLVENNNKNKIKSNIKN